MIFLLHRLLLMKLLIHFSCHNRAYRTGRASDRTRILLQCCYRFYWCFFSDWLFLPYRYSCRGFIYRLLLIRYCILLIRCHLLRIRHLLILYKICPGNLHHGITAILFFIVRRSCRIWGSWWQFFYLFFLFCLSLPMIRHALQIDLMHVIPCFLFFLISCKWRIHHDTTDLFIHTENFFILQLFLIKLPLSCGSSSFLFLLFPADPRTLLPVSGILPGPLIHLLAPLSDTGNKGFVCDHNDTDDRPDKDRQHGSYKSKKMIHQIGQGSCNDTSTVFVLAASRIDFSDLITLCQRRASRKQIEYTADQQKQDNPCDQLPGGNTVSAVYHAKCDHYKKSNWYNISQ